MSPGTTIRMRGDETLHLRIENTLGPDLGMSAPGPGIDPAAGYPGPEGAVYMTLKGDDRYGEGIGRIPTQLEPDWALGEHMNGAHSAHVTNLHSHGLHVRSGQNDNGTYSDDIYLRIVPEEDAQRIAENPELHHAFQEDEEQIVASAADFEFRLGDVMEGMAGPEGAVLRGMPHPPGTHWYHPHSHGSTQNQVASGMAGFLIVEGDVDDLVRERIAGDVAAPWDSKTGDWDFRERAMLVQRVFVAPTANIGGPSAGPDPDALMRSTPPEPLVNGAHEPGVIVMRPGAIERWRVLNGSVDGAGFMRLAVLRGRVHGRRRRHSPDGGRRRVIVAARDGRRSRAAERDDQRGRGTRGEGPAVAAARGTVSPAWSRIRPGPGSTGSGTSPRSMTGMSPTSIALRHASAATGWRSATSGRTSS